MSEENEIFASIRSDIENNDVVLYMKGTAAFPQCGFSAVTAQILKRLDVEFLDKNVLADDALLFGIKEFTNWPTTPQLYIKGEFIGGCDIVKEMFEAGELQGVLKEKGVSFKEEAA